MSERLQGKVAVVTGGSRGMGASHARGIVAEGGAVVIADVLVDEGSALADELGAAASFVELDVTDEDGWRRLVDTTVQQHGGFDVMINNAGIADLAPIIDTTLDAYHHIIEINQTGVFLGIRSSIAPMARRGGGSIVNISSVAGLIGSAMSIGYVASKFAVRGMTKAAAVELAPYGIRVNSVHPGYIRTPMLEAGGDDVDIEAMAKGTVPLDRVADPNEVTRVVLFLASHDASYCTGAEFVVDGGLVSGLVAQDLLSLSNEAIGRHL